MKLMNTVMDSQRMVGKNKSSDQVPQKKVGYSFSLEGATAKMENMVVLETNLGGRGAFRITFLTKREC